jgi:hypothetical protein
VFYYLLLGFIYNLNLSPQYLGLGTGSNPVKLFIVQKIILKAFYRGSRGNEKLALTKEEIE